MTPNENGRDFDCVEFKRQAQERIAKVIQGMTPEQEIAFYWESVDKGPIGEWWRSIEEAKQRRLQS